MMPPTMLLNLVALVFVLVSATGRFPLWPALLLVVLANLLAVWPR
jgi:hypothetical protein